MWWKHTPALAPAVGLVIGCGSAADMAPVAWGWLVALASLAVAARRPWSSAVVFLALGWGLGGAALDRQQRFAGWVQDAQPAVVEGRVISHGEALDETWRCLFEVHRVRQGDRTLVTEQRLWLRLPKGRAPELGEGLRIRGYLRRSVDAANGLRSRPTVWRLSAESERLLEVVAAPGAGWRAATRLRHLVSEAIVRLDSRGWLRERGAAWLRAMFLAEREQVPLAQRQGLGRLGLAHVMAVSGLHLAMVVALCLGLSRPLPWWVRWLLCAVAVVAYSSLIGPQASIRRAAVMALATLGAGCLKRPPEPRNALAVTVIALLVTHPLWVFDVGFRLSVSATAGILWWTPRWAEVSADSKSTVPHWLRRSLAATLAAQGATLPWLVQLHGGLHPLAWVLNLFALPWLACLLTAGLLAVATSALAAWWPALAVFAWPWSQGVGYLAELAAWVTLGPATSWHWRPWPEHGVMVCLWALTAWAGWRLDAGRARQEPEARRSGRAEASAGRGRGPSPRPQSLPVVLPVALPVVLLAVLLAVQTGSPKVSRQESEPWPELVMIDVGQGDAVLLRDGDEALLIDGGGWRRGDAGGRILWPLLASWGIGRLPGVLITHGDTDHCAGVRDVLRYLPVDNVWLGVGALSEPCPRQVLATPGPRWRPIWRGDRLRVGRWRLQVLYPAVGDAVPGNDGSLVLLATVHGRRVMLTGDLEAAGERAVLADRPDDGPVDVLKVAHHGSKTSSGERWLRRLRPRLGLISAGVDNPYGHPAPPVVERLRRHGIVLLRTDLSGLVRLQFPAAGPLTIELPGTPRREMPRRSR